MTPPQKTMTHFDTNSKKEKGLLLPKSVRFENLRPGNWVTAAPEA